MCEQELRDRIRNRRIELGLTVEELADKMGYKDKSSISKIENGKADIPQSKIKAFARALNTTTLWLIGGEDERAVPPGFQPIPATVKLPRVGSIACGAPITAEQNIEGYDEIQADWHGDFTLRCKGDSMLPKIQDGDIVVIRQQPEVENGQIAAVRIDGEATLKHVFYNPGSIILQPENPIYPPIVLTGEQLSTIHIEGLAIGLSRRI